MFTKECYFHAENILNMNPNSARLLIQKIERLFSSLEMDDSLITPIERDLMLSYIRQLYEQFLDSPVEASPAPIPDSKPAPTLHKPSSDSQIPEPRSTVLLESVPPAQKIPSAPPSGPAPPDLQRVEASQSQESGPRQPTADPEVETLFEQEQARELADKLGASPLNDLTMAFSINDRQLFINELFGRDVNVFTMTLQQLNAMRTFGEAREFLSRHIARKYKWTEKDRKSTAKAFIKTIRRKYP